MQVDKKIVFLSPLSLLIFMLSGCTLPKAPHPALDGAAPPEPMVSQQNSSVAKRFQEPGPQGQTAVESAIELSQKYAKLSEEAAMLRENNRGFLTENSQLKQQLATLDAKLKQTQKELTEANDLLIEMRIELNNWKTNVLGFRDEMREAETAQLEALLKILNILGGEVTAESAQNVNESSVAASSLEPAQPISQETSIQGKPNE